MALSPGLETVLEMAERAAREPDGEWNTDILAAYGRVAGIKLASQLRPPARAPPVEAFDRVFELMADGGRKSVGIAYHAGGSNLLEDLLSGAVGAHVQRGDEGLLVTECPLRNHFQKLGLPCAVFCGAMRKALLEIYYPALLQQVARSKDRCRVRIEEPGPGGGGLPGSRTP